MLDQRDPRMITGGKKRCIPWFGLARILGRHWTRSASRLRWSDTATEGGAKDDIDLVESRLETAPVRKPVLAAVIGACSFAEAGIIHFSTRSGGSFVALTGRGKQRGRVHCVHCVVRTHCTVYEGGAREEQKLVPSACLTHALICYFPGFLPRSPAPLSSFLSTHAFFCFLYFFFSAPLFSPVSSSLKPRVINGLVKGWKGSKMSFA